MSFLDAVEKVRAFLERNGRVSLGALRLEYDLEEAQIEALVEELVEIQGVAVRDGRALVWSDGRQSRASEASAPPGDARPDIPPHLADKIRKSRPALEGERKQVTVLFADVKGSTQLTEQAGAERWAEILDGYLRLLEEGVHRFEGTVSQYTGDGIMALFGAPIAHEDHAHRACLAALWLRDALADYAVQVRREHGISLEARIGLNSGEVVVGKIGEDLGMDYTAQGQTVHLAQRMEQLAEAGRPCLAPATAALVEGFFALDDRGEHEIKGASAPLRVHALVGMGEAHTRLAVARSRGLSQFVGRAHELESLEAALAQARAGRGQIVGMVGEAGVGKSRLCSQLLDRLRSEGVAVYPAHCLSHGKMLSFGPVLELLRALLEVTEAESESAQRTKITDELSQLDETFAETLPLVLDFLGVADPEAPAPRIESAARQRHLFRFARRLVRARSSREPVVLFLDDAHWIDAGSDAFLAQIVEEVADSRALLLLNFRPEYRADWMGRSGYQQLALRRLATEEVEALLDELIGEDASLVDLRELIRERTGGNPFFVEEVVRSLAESGALAGERGAYHLVQSIGTLEVPSTVQTVLAGRIDRLAEREKQVLQTAAVIGKEFSEPILSAVLEWPGLDLSDALQVLKDAEFVYERSLYPVSEYAFRHPLTQEVALGSQLRQRRARTHSAVAGALEVAHAERLDEQAALLAHHYEEAGEALQAASWHARAADWLIGSDQSRSNVHWRRVYELAKSEQSTQEGRELLFGACIRLVGGSFVNFFPDEERDRFAAEGREIGLRMGNQPGLFLLELALALSRNLAGGARDSALVPARRAIEIAEDLPQEAQALAHQVLGNVLWQDGSVAAALRATERAIELAIPMDLEFGVTFAGFSVKNFALFQRASLLMWSGRPSEAAVDFERSLAVCLQRKEPTATCQILTWSGPFLEELTGTAQRALERAQEAVEWAERGGDDFSRTVSICYLGMAQLKAGRVAEALDSLRYADHMQRGRGIGTRGLNLTQGLLAEAHLAAGDAAGARAAAERCAVDWGASTYDLCGHLSRSRVLRALDGAKAQGEIEASLGRAEQLLEESEAWAFRPFILEERARLLEVLGDAEAARSALHAAQRAYAEVDAAGHAARLERELGKPGENRGRT